MSTGAADSCRGSGPETTAHHSETTAAARSGSGTGPAAAASPTHDDRAGTAAHPDSAGKPGAADRDAAHLEHSSGPAAGAHPQRGSAAHLGHGPGPRDAGPGYLAGALALIVAFMIAEVTIGLLAHSLALVSDAAHMLTDAAAIALAITAMRLSARPPTGGYTYGLRRTEILSAQANGITLLLLSVWLTYEAVRRLIHPPAVAGWPVLGTALAGIVINAAAAQLTARADRTSLNVEGAFRHIVTDAYAFIATAIAGIIMITTGFNRADAIASLVVVALMARAGGGLVRESGRIFLEAAPAGLSPESIGKAMASRDGVAEVHDLHVWTITSGMPAASAHVLVGPGLDCHAVRVDLERLLEDTYQIKHTTLQVDHAPQQLLSIGRSGPDCQAHEPRPAQPTGNAAERPAESA